MRSQSDHEHDLSISELSRVVFKIIPYDKADVITYVYKMLYIESQMNDCHNHGLH